MITSHSILLVYGHAYHWEGTDLASCSTLSVPTIPFVALVRTLSITQIQPSHKRPSSFQPFPFAIPVKSIAVRTVSQPHRQHLPCTLPLPSCVHPVPSKSFANSDPFNHVGMRSPDKNKTGPSFLHWNTPFFAHTAVPSLSGRGPSKSPIVSMIGRSFSGLFSVLGRSTWAWFPP